MISFLVFALLAGLLIAAHKMGIKADQTNTVFGGVCSGIANHFDLAPRLVRVLTVIFALMTGGFAILLYIALWITLPKR